MAKKPSKLTFRFHNPNTTEATAEHLCQILVEANRAKLEAALQREAQQADPPQVPAIEPHSEEMTMAEVWV